MKTFHVFSNQIPFCSTIVVGCLKNFESYLGLSFAEMLSLLQKMLINCNFLLHLIVMIMYLCNENPIFKMAFWPNYSAANRQVLMTLDFLFLGLMDSPQDGTAAGSWDRTRKEAWRWAWADAGKARPVKRGDTRSSYHFIIHRCLLIRWIEW